MTGIARQVSIVLGLLIFADGLFAQQTVTIPAADRMLPGVPATLYSFGKAEGSESELLSRVRSVAFDARDNLYILDGGSHRVIMVDATGKFVRSFGRKGGGPGELSTPYDVIVTDGGDVVVNDVGHNAFISYSASGKYKHNTSYVQAGGRATNGVQAYPGGAIVSLVTARQKDAAAAVLFRQKLTANAEPRNLRSVTTPPLQRFVIEAKGNMPRMTVMRDPVFAPEAMFAVGRSGEVAFHYGAAYRLDVVDSTGKIVRVITRPIATRKVTDRDRAAWQERGDSAARAAGREPTKIPYDVPFAELMPIIGKLENDASGRLWAQRLGPEGADNGPIDILTSGGQYIGTLRAQHMPIAFSASGRVAYIEKDEDGVESVRVARLPAAWK